MFNILVIKNRYTKNIDFSKGIEWFEKKTPLKVKVTEISTDFDMTFKQVGNATYTGVVADGIKEQLRKIIPEGKYHTVVLVYGNKATGIRVSVCEDEPLYLGTEFVQVVKLTDKGKTFNHETVHSLFRRLIRMGVPVEDPMDYVRVNDKTIAYYNDGDLDSKDSNRAIALERLAPHWDKLLTIKTQGSASIVPTPIPTTMNQNFEKAFAHLMKWEGGYVNDPKDPGGETKYGISKRSYPSLIIANLKESEAKAIYLRDFWNPIKADAMPYSVALNVFDMAVNFGQKTGAMALQEALGVTKDGAIGPITIGAVAKMNATDLVEKIATIRILKYVSDKNFGIYGKGWIARAVDTITSSLS